MHMSWKLRHEDFSFRDTYVCMYVCVCVCVVRIGVKSVNACLLRQMCVIDLVMFMFISLSKFMSMLQRG